MIYTISPEEALVCASMMLASAVLVVVPKLLSLPVGEIYHVAAKTVEVASTNAAVKTLQKDTVFDMSNILDVSSFIDDKHNATVRNACRRNFMG